MGTVEKGACQYKGQTQNDGQVLHGDCVISFAFWIRDMGNDKGHEEEGTPPVFKISEARAYQPTTGRNMGVSKLPGGLEGGGIEDDLGTYWESTQDNHGICEQKRHLPEMCRIQTIS